MACVGVQDCIMRRLCCTDEALSFPSSLKDLDEEVFTAHMSVVESDAKLKISLQF